MAQILSHSSNVGAITIAQRLGASQLMNWIARFGFGKPTGIDFPGESGGIVPSYPDQWSGTTIGNVPIGQGIAVTPIQIASAYAAIANGGVWIQPHLVDRVGGRTLHTFKHRRIVSPAVDQQLITAAYRGQYSRDRGGSKHGLERRTAGEADFGSTQ